MEGEGEREVRREWREGEGEEASCEDVRTLEEKLSLLGVVVSSTGWSAQSLLEDEGVRRGLEGVVAV